MPTLTITAVVGLLLVPAAAGFAPAVLGGRRLARPRATVEAPTELAPDDSMFVDEEAMLAARSSDALPAARLIEIAKAFLRTGGGVGGDAELLGETFQFEGPVVGPLDKESFVGALGNVDFGKAFPDFNPEFYGFHVDPFEGDRVWYTARGKGTNTGPFPSSDESATPATGKMVVNPPQVCSLTVDHATGLITRCVKRALLLRLLLV